MAEVTFKETTKVLQDDGLEKNGKFKTREQGPVKSVDLHTKENAKAHHTNMFTLVKHYDRAIFRRGQSFKLTIEFKEIFKLSDKNLRLDFATGTKPSANNKRKVHLDVKDSNKLTGFNWSVHVASKDAKKMSLEVNIPPTCPVGLWRMSVVTQPGDKTFDASHFYVIFNPWCKDDAVYMDNENLKKEYVLQDTGRVYCANRDAKTQKVKAKPRPWGFYQFSPSVLPAAIYFLEGLENKNRKIDRASPVSVARFLTLNSSDVEAFTWGEWNIYDEVPPNNYPWTWTSSQPILLKYIKTLESVKYSQCWVYASVTCSVCRALGIPCRVVTNYSSAHDTNKNLAIDEHFKKVDGKKIFLKDLDNDSTWNFHVWNDVWMTRPDLPPGYGGWQAIDACPQETSADGDGDVCGPASLAAIKKGEVDKLYDTMFIFSEVNADRYLWIQKDSNKSVLDQVQTYIIGTRILTKAVGSNNQEDVISSYKFQEGQTDERKSMKTAAKLKKITLPEVGSERATRDTMAAQKPVTKKDVNFEFVPLKNVMIGDPVVICGILENKSKQKRTAYVAMGANSIEYTGKIKHKLDLSGSGATDAKNMVTKTIELLPGQREINALSIQLTPETYLDFLVGLGYINVYASVFVKETNDVLIARDNVIIIKPNLTIEGPTEFKTNTPITLKLKFNNPLNRELKKCSFNVSTNCTSKSLTVDFRNVKPKENVSHEVNIMPTFSGPCSFIGRFDSDVLMDVMGIMEANCL